MTRKVQTTIYYKPDTHFLLKVQPFSAGDVVDTFMKCVQSNDMAGLYELLDSSVKVPNEVVQKAIK